MDEDGEDNWDVLVAPVVGGIILIALVGFAVSASIKASRKGSGVGDSPKARSAMLSQHSLRSDAGQPDAEPDATPDVSITPIAEPEPAEAPGFTP